MENFNMAQKQDDFNTALEALLHNNDYKKIISEMVANGFDVNSCDEQGFTLKKQYRTRSAEFYRLQDGSALFSFEYDEVKKYDKERMEFLEQLGAKDETEQSKYIQQKIEETRQLAQQKREAQEKNKYLETLPKKSKITSLDDALKYEDANALKSLIDKGQDINACDNDGNTMLKKFIDKRGKYDLEVGMSQMEGRYHLSFTEDEYKHLSRVIDMLQKEGAVIETPESKNIKKQKELEGSKGQVAKTGNENSSSQQPKNKFSSKLRNILQRKLLHSQE